MDALALIHRLHQHRVWVNHRLCDAAATLGPDQFNQPFEMGRGSLWATLVHLYGAEFVWLEALYGREMQLPTDDAFATFEELRIAWAALDRRWQRFLDELTPGKLALPVRRRGMTTPASDVLLHVCTHAHYTVAQGINMLRRLGVPADRLPDPMLITLSRQEHNP